MQTAGNLAKARKRFVYLGRSINVGSYILVSYVYAECARGKNESNSLEERTDSRTRTFGGLSSLPGTTLST